MSIALIQGDKVLSSFQGYPETTQSEELMAKIHEVLAGAKVGVNDVTHVLYGIGPGSFTSLRIGLATLKGLFWDKNIQFYTMSSLLFRAYSVEEGHKTIMPMICMGRKRLAVGSLSADGFSERLYEEKEFDQIKNKKNQNTCWVGDGVSLLDKKKETQDIFNNIGFLKVLQNKQYQENSLDTVSINYLAEPDIG